MIYKTIIHRQEYLDKQKACLRAMVAQFFPKLKEGME